MKKITYILLSACFLLTSCEDFLNRDPDAKVGSGDYFTDEGSLLTNISTGSSRNTTRRVRSRPGVTATAYCGHYRATETVVRRYLDQRFVELLDLQRRLVDQYTGTPIYNINYLPGAHARGAGASPKLPTTTTKARRVSGAHGSISRQVKTFGAVPWYDEPIDPEDMVALYKPRDSREYVMERVLEDLNFACEHCYTSSDMDQLRRRINRYIALAIQGPRLPVRRHLPQIPLASIRRRARRGIPNTSKATNKWLRECGRCLRRIDGGGRLLASSTSPADVRPRNTVRSSRQPSVLNTTEVMWARQMQRRA